MTLAPQKGSIQLIAFLDTQKIYNKTFTNKAMYAGRLTI